MATYPGPKVHRVSRRHLSKGQFPAINGAVATITSTASTATITFQTPVVVAGIIPLAVIGGPTFVSQTVVSPTVVTQTFSAALATHTYNLPSNAANVATFQGGKTVGESGTF